MQLRGKVKYNIGEISQICGLSIKTLRYYDAKGVLVPSNRDEHSNYRYYSEDQILMALAIREMKLRGFTLEELQEIIDSDSFEKTSENLDKKMHCITEEIKRLEKQLKLVKNSNDIFARVIPEVKLNEKLNDAQGGQKRKIIVSDMNEVHCLYTRYRSRVFAQEIFWDRFAEIFQLIDEKGYVVNGPIMAVFHEHYTHQFFFDEGDLEILQPISNPGQDDENVKKFGGFQVASLIYVGFYAGLLPEYIALIKWIEANGYDIAGNAIEEYLVEFTQGVSKDKFVTRISFPVRKRQR